MTEPLPLSEFTFEVKGRVTAKDREQALERLSRALRIFGFGDIGDGSLWLDRPKGSKDDLGMALAGMDLYIDDIEIGLESPIEP